MKIAIAIIVLLGSIPAMAGMTTVEFATGIGSPYWVTNDNWRGSVGSDGLFFKEYAARVEYSFSRNWGISTAAGWVHYLDLSATTLAYENYFHNHPSRKISYLIPSVCISSSEFNLRVGALFYRTASDIRRSNFPFESGHRLLPAISIELGTPEFYLLGGFYNSIPLFSESLEMGAGRRFSSSYDHRIFLYRSAINSYGIGYRGEFGVFKMNSLILGISGGIDDNSHEMYTFTLGIKFSFGHKSDFETDPDL